MGWELEGMGIPHGNGMIMGISEKNGEGNGRELECKKPFPVTSNTHTRHVAHTVNNTSYIAKIARWLPHKLQTY